jgi:hypothetical protein
MKIFSRASPWLAVAALGSYLLQLLPFPGIFMMLLGGPFLTGALIDLFFVALFVEALMGRLPRILMVIPVAALAAYYGLCLQQVGAQRKRATEIRAANLGPGSIAFDPAHMSLVDDLALGLVGRYRVARAYRSSASGYSVNLVATAKQCQSIPDDSGGLIRKSYGPASLDDRHAAQICDLSFPNPPPGQILSITHTGRSFAHEGEPESLETTEFRLGGALKGNVTKIHFRRMTLFPLLVAGCMPKMSRPSWVCFHNFLDAPVMDDTHDVTAAERMVLGLREHSDSDFDNFQGYPENASLLEAARAITAGIQPAAPTSKP